MTEGQYGQLVRFLTEQFTAADRKVDAGFTAIDARFAEVDARFARVDERLDEMQQGFDALRTEVREGFDNVNGLMRLLGGRVSALEKRDVTARKRRRPR